ncbi:MAG: bifunctional 5,10-methylenetetrahydrofolate dehydrogenase/5,10-methenyltetrahydrofolate cyclohydrolase [Patescibacteria group bacterium]|nr:bifunctional 5,10-methylenetetrahydrofolate dehydrogenase/5,10-methenyltetrahydrofolate cyclohydrolase [Patescibacteria group bacterium]
MVIDGRKISKEIIEKLRKEPKIKKFLGAFLVGDNPASISFLKQKEKVAQELEINFRLYKFPETISQDELRKEILKIANHKTCGGIIVQLPLPEHINKYYVLNVIPREKDVDVLGERALGAFYNDRNPVLPPAVGVVIKTIRAHLQDLREAPAGVVSLVSEGVTSRGGRMASAAGAEEHPVLEKLASARVMVVGLGFLVGKPISTWLMGKAKEIYLFDIGSDLSSSVSGLKQADLVISGVGKAGLIKSEILKQGTGVIDFGYSEINGKLAGDLDLSGNISKLSFYTPTPGGTGPILVAQLFENFYKLN